MYNGNSTLAFSGTVYRLPLGSKITHQHFMLFQACKPALSSLIHQHTFHVYTTECADSLIPAFMQHTDLASL